jgi:hypothetical protein
MSSKHIAHARRRDHDAELPQLADDAEIAPPRVLPSQTKDDCDDLSIERVGSDRLRTREPPVPANEISVPAYERCRRDEEGGPALAAEEIEQALPAPRDRQGRTEVAPLGASAPRVDDTQHRDLDVLLVRRRTDSNQAEQLSNEQEGYRTAHADDPGTLVASLVRAAFLRLHPTGPIPTNRPPELTRIEVGSDLYADTLNFQEGSGAITSTSGIGSRVSR